jgi:2-amino-4-hydroxy-6-hydroxymethyldihydropteridine diphosphokinase
VTSSTRRAVLSVGSNMGDRLAHLQGALDLLVARGISIVAVSSVYRTAPVGGPDQDDFLNAIAIVESSLTPHDLLAVCLDIEARHDRVREVRWGPRTLDVDVIDISDVAVDDDALTVPHPRAHERAFVCVPWLEVDPEAAIAGRGIATLQMDASGVHRCDDLTLVVPAGER